MEEKKICIIVIVRENIIEKIQKTINNLTNNGCTNEEYIIAVKKNEMEETLQYCTENSIQYYEYENIKDVYCELPKQITSDYISFIEEGDKYSKNFRGKLLKRINKDQIKSVYIMPAKNKYRLNKNLEKGKKVVIEKNPEKIWINIKFAFLCREDLLEVIDDIKEELEYYIGNNILMKIIIGKGVYKIIRNIKLKSSKKLEDAKESKLESYDILWYNNLISNMKNLTEYSKKNFGSVIKFLQYDYLYMIKNVINENVNTKNKHMLKEESKQNFYKNLAEILKDLDDEIIMKTYGKKIINFYLINLKYGNEGYQYRNFKDQICVMNHNTMIFNAEDEKIKILLMDYIDGVLNITAKYALPFIEEKLRIYAKYNDEIFEVSKNYLYSQYKIFGDPIHEEYVFDLKIPLKANSEKKYIEFFIQSGESNFKLDVNFKKPLSRLTKSKYAYWECGNFTLNYRKKSIMVMNNSKLRHIKREFKYVRSLISNKKKRVRKAGYLRLLYDITKPFYKKEIWLFEDKIFKGGDNGEYLYTYASKQKDDIKKYYILDKKSLDAKRFKKEKKKFVNYGTIKHKLLFFNSSIVFETHNSATKHHAFDDKNEKFFRDLFNSNNVCIQHGLSVQYIPHLVNRINDNMKLFFLASNIEKINLENKEYAYENHTDILKITGSPRYDGLINNDKRQILITPTWRNYLAMPALNVVDKRKHNNNFKKSEYFKLYNNLINNEKLIRVAKETGYKIIYLLHPCTSSQIDDFDKNDDVELIAATEDLNYEKILTESSLMVTDYSGVQFDFAYMYKPIVYFHPEELPPSYDEGEYKYETMSLGEIVKKSDELVDTLCEYMRNNCKIKPEYEKRIDKFFKYHDHNNCKRIYEEIMKFRNGEKTWKAFSKKRNFRLKKEKVKQVSNAE